MGGKDKGLMLFRGKPFIAHIHAVVRELTDDLIISCNRNQAVYATYSDRCASDSVDGYPGPLAGVIAGLEQARHAWMLVLPCDAPLVDRALVRAMLAHLGKGLGYPLMLRQGSQWQPMFSLLPKALLPTLEAAWAAGERSLLRLLLAARAKGLPCSCQDLRLQNLNSPEVLLAAQSGAIETRP